MCLVALGERKAHALMQPERGRRRYHFGQMEVRRHRLSVRGGAAAARSRARDLLLRARPFWRAAAGMRLRHGA